MEKIVNCIQSSHLDLFWMGRMEHCMELGAKIINDAVRDLSKNRDKYFVVETVRFLEYYLDRYPENKKTVKKLLENGQLEVGASYTDRLENHHSGESLVRNVIYGKKMLQKLVGMDSAIAAHPDLPGLAEQTPQIYKKAGVKYYIFARGYPNGARFKWAAPNGETLIAYNYPIHYSYYDYEKLFKRLDEVEKAVKSDEVLISMSAGDLGEYGTFLKPINSRIKVPDIMERFNRTHQDRILRFAGVYPSLSGLDESNLPTYRGECPSKWGTYGSATNVVSFQQDKQLSAALGDAEKLVSLCRMNQIEVDEFSMNYPFCLLERPHMLRDYYDAKIRPGNVSEWIDFAWRLQLITQDHNYGGIDGVASAFDRFIYKKCAIEIADNLVSYCIKNLSKKIDAGDGIVAVNTLNWKRTGKVYLTGDLNKQYVACGADGREYTVVQDEDGRLYFEPELDALSYEYFHIEGRNVQMRELAAVYETDGEVTIESPYYKAVFSKKAGGLTVLCDKESGKNLLGNTPAGIFSLYEDPSNDVHEVKYRKTLIDTTAGMISRVESGQNALYVWIKWYGEISNSKVCVTLKLSTGRKEFSLIPEVYWLGYEQSQLRMSLGLNPEFNDLYYGVPYGIEKYGNYMYGAEPVNPSDEISMELFREYREIQGWFAVQSEKGGISFGTNHSAFAFRSGNDFELVLIRDVVSCGDIDVMMDNHGHQTFNLVGTSFKKEDVTKNDIYYKKAWEVQHPLAVSAKNGEVKGPMPCKGALFHTTGGILSVLQSREDGYLARIFSVSKKTEKIALYRNHRQLSATECDLLGREISGDLTLRFGDIKTVKFPYYS